LEKDIFSTGFYRQKTKSIKNCCSVLIEKYNGKVPSDFDELTKLPGVGRKTASVVAGNAFGIPAIAVDTHVIRLSNLFDFVKTKNPEQIEKRLKELFPDIKVILCTGYDRNHAVQELLDQGVVAFLQKPYEIDQIAKVCKELSQPTGQCPDPVSSLSS